MPNEKPEVEVKSRALARRDFMRGMALAAAATSAAGAAAPARAHGRGSGRVRHFIKEVLDARVFDLSPPWDENAPIASVNPPFTSFLNATHGSTRGTFGDGGQLSFASEIQQWSGQHGAPSIDAIGHIGRDGKLFGGVDAAAATADTRGIGRSGVGAHLDMANYPTKMMVNRGVLLDVARFVKGDLSPPCRRTSRSPASTWRAPPARSASTWSAATRSSFVPAGGSTSGRTRRFTRDRARRAPAWMARGSSSGPGRGWSATTP
jgi:hypothetical protein